MRKRIIQWKNHKVQMALNKRKAAAAELGYGSEEAKNTNLKWKCEHCDRSFQDEKWLKEHIDNVHTCHICRKVVKDIDKDDHAEMHKRQKAEKVEAERKRKQFYDGFVGKFIRTKKLNEYQSDEELDFYYIFENYQDDIDDEQLLYFVKHGMDICHFADKLDNEKIIFLLENNAVSEDDAANCIYSDMGQRKELIEYFLEKNFAIKPRWVADLINEDDLIELIKEKHNFKFEDIFSEGSGFRKRDSESEKEFYNAVHAHFPDPNYIVKKDPRLKFKCVTTKHADDYFHHRYYYDEKNDELSIMGERDYRVISLGRCKKMIEKENNLVELIAKYRDAIEKYNDVNERVSERFAEIYAVTDRYEDDRREYGMCFGSDYGGGRFERDCFGFRRHTRADSIRYNMYRILDSDLLPDRNHWANVVSHTYFVIAQKLDTVLTLEHLAIRKIAKEKINFDQLPSVLKQKIAESESF